MKFELLVSWRYLSRRRKKNLFLSAVAAIAVGGVAVSVMTVVVVLAVMNGFGRELEERITSNIAPVTVESFGAFSDYRDKAEKISGIDGVEAVSPYIMRQALIRHYSGADGIMVYGAVPGQRGGAHHVSDRIKDGSFELDEKKIEFPGEARSLGGIVLGKTLASRLGAGVGSTVSLIAAGPSGEDGPPGSSSMQFSVRGIFDTGMHEYDSSLAYISFETARELFGAADYADGLDVRVHDIYRAEDAAEKISGLLGPLYFVSSWQERHSNLFAALALEKRTMFVILSLIVAVAVFNIMSTLVMLVMEKTKDIGILKSIGAGRQSIMLIFIIAGVFIGAAGAVLGSAAGFALCKVLEKYPVIQLPGDIYLLDTLPVSMSGQDFLVTGFLAFIASMAAAAYPAVRASRLNPVEALRYE